MKITVILCTYNRCLSLENALNSIAASKMPESTEWEVLVVDNNSHDKTRMVVEDVSQRYPGRFRYVFESQPGKSHALNRGIQEAYGEVLAFMDDDVTVDSAWLQNLTAKLIDNEWVGAGGPIHPLWSSLRPEWLSLETKYALAPVVAFDLGQEAGQISEPPWGTNMAFRRQVFEKYGAFRTHLGPRPGSQIRGEDCEFGQRLLDRGERIRYEPSAVVYHPVTKERLTKRYHLEWWFDHGRAYVLQHGALPNTKYFVAGVPLYLFRRLAVWTIRWMVAVDSGKRFDCKRTVWSISGQIVEALHSRTIERRQGGDAPVSSVGPPQDSHPRVRGL